uniref:DUF2905 domain-containing protein n=1 Tax=Paraburkholderia terrae TaxID=311230 RepID=UPI003EBE911B
MIGGTSQRTSPRFANHPDCRRSRLPLGRLPGDINIVRPEFNSHLPSVTCIVISVVLSILLWLFRR